METFTLDALDIIIPDEADRMLPEGFTDKLEEIIKPCPKPRQTTLVDPERTTVRGIVQEFVRVRADKEAER